MEICSSYRCAVTQHQCTAALFKAKCNPHCSMGVFAVTQACCQPVLLSNTDQCKMCLSLFFRARPMHCSTGQGKIASMLFSAALQTSLTACLCQCNYTYGDLLFLQVCNDATPMHCSTDYGKTASLLFSTALQNRLTACLCHCNYTYGDLLFTQMCNDATPKHCSTGPGRTASLLFGAALQTSLTACLCHCN